MPQNVGLPNPWLPKLVVTFLVYFGFGASFSANGTIEVKLQYYCCNSQDDSNGFVRKVNFCDVYHDIEGRVITVLYWES